MKADKRSVHTDALTTLGTIIDERAKRDAIHVAVEPCVAGQMLYPGQPVQIINGIAERNVNTPVGIVDPFLNVRVQEGQRFWLLLFPRQITSLRHVWTHPAFDDNDAEETVSSEQKTASEQWLRAFCENAECPDYDDVINAAIGINVLGDTVPPSNFPNYFNISNDGEYLYFGGRTAHGEIPAEFWDHVEIVTGVKIPNGNRAKYFTCSC